MAHVGNTSRARCATLWAFLAFSSACRDESNRSRDESNRSRDESDGSRDEPSDSATCPFEVDELLHEVGQSIPGRVDCGSFNVVSSEEIVRSLDCLLGTDGSPEAPTEMHVTRCTDCFIQSTYVATPEGKIFHVFREADGFSDDQLEVAVERCENVVEDNAEVVRCVEPVPLFACQESIPALR